MCLISQVKCPAPALNILLATSIGATALQSLTLKPGSLFQSTDLPSLQLLSGFIKQSVKE